MLGNDCLRRLQHDVNTQLEAIEFNTIIPMLRKILPDILASELVDVQPIFRMETIKVTADPRLLNVTWSLEDVDVPTCNVFFFEAADEPSPINSILQQAALNAVLPPPIAQNNKNKDSDVRNQTRREESPVRR